MAATAEGYLTVWENYADGDLFGARLAKTEGLSVPFPICKAPKGQTDPAVASDGCDYLVAWRDDRAKATAGVAVYAARVTGGGVVLERDGFPISAGASSVYMPTLAFGGTDYLVAWTASMDGFTGTRVSPSGVLLTPGGFRIQIPENPHKSKSVGAVASNGTDYLAVWRQQSSPLGDPYDMPDIGGTFVGNDGLVVDQRDMIFSTAANDQTYPAVAFNGTRYLVVWEDNRGFAAADGDLDIFATRVLPTGMICDPNGIPVSTAPQDQFDPAVAALGEDFLVVWQDHRDVDWRVRGRG